MKVPSGSIEMRGKAAHLKWADIGKNAFND